MGLFKKDESNDFNEKKKAKEAKKQEARDLLKSEFGRLKVSMKSELESAKNSFTGEFSGVDAETLYSAVLQAGVQKKYSLLHSDRPSLSATFQTHEGEIDWDGVLSCFVQNTESGAKLKVSARAEQGLTQSGKITINPLRAALAQATEAKVEGVKHSFKSAVTKELVRMPIKETGIKSTSPTDQGVTNDLASQILKLKNLLDSGVINQQEFEKAKAKLLEN